MYNAAAYLDECLSSVVGQSCGAFEAICIDDGSTDESREILGKWAARDGRIRVLDKQNGGPSSARNEGIRAARGDFLCFLDADDLLEANACQRILEEFERSSCDCVVYGWSCFPPAQANAWLTERTNVRDAFYPRFSSALLFEEMTNPFLRVAVRRELLGAFGLRFDESLRVGEDSAFLFALFPRAKGVRLVSDKLYRYRMPHEGSITSESRDGTAEKCADDLAMMIAIFEDWDNAGLLRPNAAQLIHWQISFFLYTALRQPEHIRAALALAVKELWLSHFTPEELRALPLPRHDFKLVDIVMSATATSPNNNEPCDYKLGMNERNVAKLMFEWRVAEHGALDLAKAAVSRVVPIGG